VSDWAAEQFGEIPQGTASESPEPNESAAAGGDDLHTEHADGSEGTLEAAATAATPAESAGTTPETPAATTDPLADTEPLTFTVNGRTVANDGIRVFKEGGAVITPEALADVQTKLGERESLFERNRAQSVEYQTLSKVTEWTNPEGRTFSGPDAAIEMRIGNASLAAENKLLIETLTDPAKLISVLMTEQVPDGRGGLREQLVLNPAALQAMQREHALTSRELANAIRDHYRGVVASAAQAQPAPVDFTAEAPKLMQAVADAAKLDPTVLTPQDRALLAKQIPYHTKDGKVSLEWQELVKERIQLRADQKAQQQTLVASTSKAATDTAARMAAAARGVKQTVAPTTPAVRPATPSPQSERVAAESDAFALMLNAGANAMRQR